MLKGSNITHYSKFSLVAALLYCPFVGYYILTAKFANSWILYAGNVLFAIAVSYFLFHFNNKRRQAASSMRMLGLGHLVTVMGIIIACVISVLLLLILYHGTLQRAPTQVAGEPNDVVFAIFLNTIIGNFCTGAFVSVLFSFTITKRQERE